MRGKRLQVAFAAVAALCLTATLIASAYQASPKALATRHPVPVRHQQVDKINRQPKVPPLVSKTKADGVYIESAVIDDTLPGGTLVVALRNDTDKPVASFLVRVEEEVEGSHGLIEPGESPAIEPHGVAHVRIPLPNLNSLDSDVTLNAVVFADGTESGDKGALDYIKWMRRHVQEQQSKKGQTNAGQGGKDDRSAPSQQQEFDKAEFESQFPSPMSTSLNPLTQTNARGGWLKVRSIKARGCALPKTPNGLTLTPSGISASRRCPWLRVIWSL